MSDRAGRLRRALIAHGLIGEPAKRPRVTGSWNGAERPSIRTVHPEAARDADA